MGSREVDGSGGKGLAVNTDGMIICVSIVHEKDSRHWCGEEEKKKKENRKESGS